MDGYDTHHLDSAQLDERGQFARPTESVAEFGHHDFVASFEIRYKLFPFGTQCFVIDRFLYHLYTTVLLHPLFVSLESVVTVRLEYVTYFCHITVRFYDNKYKCKSFILN
jgi:hypothetical protein